MVPTSPQAVAEALRTIDVEIGDDVTDGNLKERILVAVRQVSVTRNANSGAMGQTGNPQEQNQQLPTPIAMSEDEDEEENNSTGTEDDSEMSKNKQQPTDTSEIIQFSAPSAGSMPIPKAIRSSVRNHYAGEVRRLIAQGKMNDKWASKHLTPLFGQRIEDFQFSMDDDGNPEHGELDILLSAFEDIPEGTFAPADVQIKQRKGQIKFSSKTIEETEDFPDEFSQGLDDEGVHKADGEFTDDQQEVHNEMLAMMGDED
jgi:hypothetical protein